MPAKEEKSLEDATAAVSEMKIAYDPWTLRDDTTIDYGYLGRTHGHGIENASTGFYITTAINYTNGPAHIGHAYEAVTSDVIARFHRSKGTEPTFFLTGSDEHGQKVAKTAEDKGMEPIEVCNQYVTGFQVLNQRALISNDDYLRTTSARHKQLARALWKRCAHDIYLDTYSGWYNVREENFVTDSEAALSDYKDPTSGLPLKQMKEESYFFKMSKYHHRLVQHIEDNPDFIRPEQHRNLILQRLRSDDLRDLSISRNTFSWGITVPDGFDQKHVMYVWVDALSNYLTGVNALGVDNDEKKKGFDKFWPANVHIIGKDILWFHTVIWPCLLMSAGLPLPKTVFAHGFVNDRDGKKMSKSMGNVVNPHDMLDKFVVDTFRWYLCKEAPYGGELSFSEDSMRAMHNADLCDTLGNLLHRVTNLCQKYCDGVVPEVPCDALPVNLTEVVASYQTKMENFELQGGASVAIQGFRDVNGYLQEVAPWKLKGDEHAETRQRIVRTTLESCYALAHLLMPFLPVGSKKIFQKLATEPVALNALNLNGMNLKPGTKIEIGEVLYEKSISDEEKKNATEASSKKESFEEAQKRKKEARAKAMANSGTDPNQPEFTKMDIRVGRITKVWNHEKADKLYCEEIDLAEESGPRQIASGLREHYSLEEMQDRLVLVVCNLKAAKLFDFVSNGMVLAAKSDDKVELIEPPSGATVGERVFIDGLTGEPVSSTQLKKRKVWENVSKTLTTNAEGLATWDGKVIQTTAGPCKSPTLVNAPIS